MLERFGRPVTMEATLRDALGIEPPQPAPLIDLGEAVRVILDGEERVADGRYLGPDKRHRGRVRVRIAPRSAGVSTTVSVDRWRILKGRTSCTS